MVVKIRRTVRLFAAGVLYYLGILDLLQGWRRSMLRTKQVCVLGFHRVLAEDEQTNSLDGVVLREATFAKMLDFIHHYYEVVTLDEFVNGKGTHGNSTRPLCLLTFDDGWRDNYTRAFPWLKKYGFPATIFLAVGFIGTPDTFWVERMRVIWDNPARRKLIESRLGDVMGRRAEAIAFEEIVEYLKHMSAERRQGILKTVLPPQQDDGHRAGADLMLTWDQVVEMSKDKIEFGAHTLTHPLLTHEPDMSTERELVMGKQIIEQKLGTRVRAFAYPNGDWDGRIRRKVAEAGYDFAFTTQPGWHRLGGDPFTIRRILLHGGNVTGLDGRFSPAAFSLSLTGWQRA